MKIVVGIYDEFVADDLTHDQAKEAVGKLNRIDTSRSYQMQTDNRHSGMWSVWAYNKDLRKMFNRNKSSFRTIEV